MKIILSIDAVKPPLTGIGRYTYELAKELETSDLEDLIFSCSRQLTRKLPDIKEGAASSPTIAVGQLLRKNTIARELYRAINPWLVGRSLRGLEDHVFHGPNYYLPPFSGRSVVTIHDLSVFLWPESHPKERVRFMQSEIALSLKRTSAIITDAEFTKNEVVNFFGVNPNNVFAVPLACSHHFCPRTAEELAFLLPKYGIAPGSYSLFVGTVEPRKNIAVLLDAYARLDPALRRRHPLVISGFRGWKSEDLHARMQVAEREGWLRYLGFVPSADLPLIISGARLFAYPSLYEGFGLPILEAMASGIPVIASNASTLPEVSGGAASLHDPQDVDELSSLLEQGLQDDMWHATHREAGLLRAREFSWRRCAQQTIDVYKTLT